MKIKKEEIFGIPAKVLVIEDDDTPLTCESCFKTYYNHPLLAKEEDEWCMNCNDAHYRKDFSDIEMGKWAMNQILKGKIVVVAMEVKE
tara:strand:+ start:1574 stop:1837 length:264 start_codon:yes stop_codon:yes gene_type:complete